MKSYDWTGPKGTAITISTGSRKPPRWALLLIDRVCARESIGWMALKWTQTASRYRGASGYCYGTHHITIKASVSEEQNRYVVIHELGHAANPFGGRHGDHFYDSMVRVAKAEKSLGLVRRIHVTRHAKAPLTRAIRRAKEAA